MNPSYALHLLVSAQTSLYRYIYTPTGFGGFYTSTPRLIKNGTLTDNQQKRVITFLPRTNKHRHFPATPWVSGVLNYHFSRATVLIHDTKLFFYDNMLIFLRYRIYCLLPHITIGAILLSMCVCLCFRYTFFFIKRSIKPITTGRPMVTRCSKIQLGGRDLHQKHFERSSGEGIFLFFCWYKRITLL